MKTKTQDFFSLSLTNRGSASKQPQRKRKSVWNYAF